MKIAIVTGAAGFIGRSLSHRLAQEGVEVYALDLPEAEKAIAPHALIHFFPVDLTCGESLSNCLNGVDADVFYHLAWSGVSTTVKNDISLQTQNIDGCLNALRACVEIGCKHVVIPGSASEYAYCGEKITGNNQPAPGDAYAASKAAAHILCQWYARQNAISLNWLLIGSIYGPGRNDNNIITYTVKALLHCQDTSYSKLEQMWDYIYIDDLMDALFCIGDKGRADKCYPVGSGNARPLHQYIEEIRDIIAPDLPLGIGKQEYKCKGKPDNSVLDISELTADTGFVPKVSFAEGIARTIDYFRNMENNTKWII